MYHANYNTCSGGRQTNKQIATGKCKQRCTLEDRVKAQGSEEEVNDIDNGRNVLFILYSSLHATLD